jgi:hypothetical protein
VDAPNVATCCAYIIHVGPDKHWITNIYDKAVVAIVQLGSATLRGIYE